MAGIEKGSGPSDPQVQSIIDHLRSLDGEALVDANHDMERAIRNDNNQDLPLWLRDVPQEVILLAKQEMARIRHKAARTLNRAQQETPADLN